VCTSLLSCVLFSLLSVLHQLSFVDCPTDTLLSIAYLDLYSSEERGGTPGEGLHGIGVVISLFYLSALYCILMSYSLAGVSCVLLYISSCFATEAFDHSSGIIPTPGDLANHLFRPGPR